MFRIRIRIGSSFDGLLDPDPEGGKSAQKRRKDKVLKKYENSYFDNRWKKIPVVYRTVKHLSSATFLSLTTFF
jgi:hypothetical protein